MDAKLKALYQQTLLQHSKSPRNYGTLEDARNATVRNTVCGDEVTVYSKTGDDQNQQITFTAQSCSICKASASMMTEKLTSLSGEEAKMIAEKFVSNFPDKPENLALDGDLSALAGVHAFPARIRCATLPWEAFLAC